MSSLGSMAVSPDYLRVAAADRRRRTLQKYGLVIAMLAPGMLLFFIFVLMPIGQSTVYSFYRWDGFGPPTNFQEFGNFERLFGHAPFKAAVSHTLMLIAMSLLVQLPLAMGLSLVVGRGALPGRRIFRMLLFVPYVFSEVITALIWRYVLDPASGLANVIIRTFVPDAPVISWLGEQNLVMVAIFFVLTWKYFGFYMILYMAALQNVPADLEEAARIDGASEGQVIRFITLPLMGPTIRTSIYLSVLGSVQQFVVVWVMTGGGPLDWSETMATYVYKHGIQRMNLGYGSAAAVVLFSFTAVFSLVYQRLVLRRDYYAES